jgi:hypothetical protein
MNQHDALSIFTVLSYVSGPFVAHHQEVVSVCVANGTIFTSKLSVGLLTTDNLEVKQVPFAKYIHSTS